MIEVTILRISKLKVLSLIAKQVLLNLRIDPVWLELVDLLVPDDRLTLDSILFVLILYHYFFSMVKDEVEWAQVLNLLILVVNTLRIDPISLKAQVCMKVVARCHDDLYSLMLLHYLFAVEQ